MALFRLAVALSRAGVAVTTRRLFRGAALPGWRWRTEVVNHALRTEGLRSVRLPLDAVRARLPAAVLPLPREIAKQVALWPTSANGVPAETTVPKGWTEGDPTVLYMHGGGYVLGSPETHRELVARIALASKARCVSIDYRLAPEHPCPAAVEDAAAAYRGLLDEGTPPASIVLAGDSAGGGLAVATLLRLVASGDPMPRAGVLLSPWVDMTCAGESIDTNARYCYLQRPAIELFAQQYLHGRHPRDPVASPVHADLSGLPPLLVQAGSAEALYSECLLLFERAKAAGVDVTLQVGDGMVHVWQAFARVLPEARPFIDQIGRFVRDRVAAAEGPLRTMAVPTAPASHAGVR
jgi:acetyl esterase/lipase